VSQVRTPKIFGLIITLALVIISIGPAKQQLAQTQPQEPNRPAQSSPQQTQGEQTTQQPRPNPAANPQAPPEPKNLQVLKGMSRQQVFQEMQSWASALGVQCNFCHQMPTMELDTPRKATARLMLRDYVMGMKHKDGSAVTCNHCHQGQPNLLRTRPFENSMAKASSGLQVLGALSEDKLMEVMQGFTQALGVNCAYCHKENFGEETPRKQIARFMMTEFSRGLTKKDGSAVGCNDCHQGQARPLTRLPFPRREQPPRQQPRPGSEPADKKPYG